MQWAVAVAPHDENAAAALDGLELCCIGHRISLVGGLEDEQVRARYPRRVAQNVGAERPGRHHRRVLWHQDEIQEPRLRHRHLRKHGKRRQTDTVSQCRKSVYR